MNCRSSKDWPICAYACISVFTVLHDFARGLSVFFKLLKADCSFEFVLDYNLGFSN